MPRMHERPIGDLVDALRQLGCQIDYLGNEAIRRCASASPRCLLDASPSACAATCPASS
jgi:3-phosphoshikimate 1-carboxyvinyltransferase